MFWDVDAAEDCTGSMGSYIKAAQENIQSIVSRIGHHGAKVRTVAVGICWDHMASDVLRH